MGEGGKGELIEEEDKAVTRRGEGKETKIKKMKRFMKERNMETGCGRQKRWRKC